MALQSLTPPQDITWKRMAYSRDMIDTNFGDLAFPPKWRSSLAIYYYIVPEEETADAYPDSKIVYLKLTCSITGWNPSEELLAARKIAEANTALDDLQKSIWNAVSSKGWSSVYWPCLGAIMQVAVYPSKGEEVGPDDFPYIMDFEPKKRELYESVSEGSEILSSSSDKLSTTKGNTNTQEVGAKVSGGIPGIGGSISANASWQQVNSNMTDTSRENRETLSRTASFSQMYQLFNGYHLGTNRALFVVAPRPHTVSNGAQTEFNLINGERKLEGIQEMFLVVHLPNKLSGFCVQASLDTGHTVQLNTTRSMIMLRNDDDFGGHDIDIPDADPEPPQPEQPQAENVQQLVVTRRIVQNCGKFDENGNFTLVGGGFEKPNYFPPVVWEDLVLEVKDTSRQRRNTVLLGSNNKNEKFELANQMNLMQSSIMKSMISGISESNYKQKPFNKTDTFLRMSGFSLHNQNDSVELLGKLKYIDKEDLKLLVKFKIKTVSELFKIDEKRVIDPAIKKIRAKILKKALIKQ
jgi:hypothetical protein